MTGNRYRSRRTQRVLHLLYVSVVWVFGALGCAAGPNGPALARPDAKLASLEQQLLQIGVRSHGEYQAFAAVAPADVAVTHMFERENGRVQVQVVYSKATMASATVAAVTTVRVTDGQWQAKMDRWFWRDTRWINEADLTIPSHQSGRQSSSQPVVAPMPLDLSSKLQER